MALTNLSALKRLFIFMSVAQLSATIEVRLQPQTADHQGTVQIRYNATSAWGTICDDKWQLPDANVICKMLQFDSATEAHVESELGKGEGPVWFDEVECNGNEENIGECERLPGWGGGNCDPNHSEDAGVTCLPRTVTTIALPTTISNCNASTNMRIVDGPNIAVGRVEVQIQNNRWGTVCDDRFGYLEAKVVCRGLCFGDGYAKPYIESGTSIPTIDDSVREIYLDELACDGTEASLLDCAGLRNDDDCEHKEDAVVSCINYSEAPPLPPAPQVICNTDTMEIAFNRSTYSALQPNNVNVEDAQTNCQQQKTTNVTFIAITLSYIGCTSTSETNDTHIIYSGSIRYDVMTGNVIQRTHIYHLPVYCAIPRDGEANRPFQPVTQTAPPQIGSGVFNFDMLIYTDDNYRSPVTSYPFNVTLGSHLNVAVLLQSRDDQIKEIVPECWVTTTSNSSSSPFYPLISNKCPTDSTVRIFPLNETMFGFRLQSLKFVNYTYVYVHCSVFVCRVDEKSDACDQTCEISRGKRQIIEQELYELTEIMQGPIYIINELPEPAEDNIPIQTDSPPATEMAVKHGEELDNEEETTATTAAEKAVKHGEELDNEDETTATIATVGLISAAESELCNTCLLLLAVLCCMRLP